MSVFQWMSMASKVYQLHLQNILFSPAVSATAVFIQSVRGKQKLQAADFRLLDDVRPPPKFWMDQDCRLLLGDVPPPPGKIQYGWLRFDNDSSLFNSNG